MRWSWGVLALLGLVADATPVTIATKQGTTTIALWDAGADGPLVSLPLLSKAVGGSIKTTARSATFTVTGTSYQFLVGTMMVTAGTHLRQLPAMVRLRHDTVFVPLAFLADVMTDPTAGGWKWVPGARTLSAPGVAAPKVATTTMAKVDAKVVPPAAPPVNKAAAPTTSPAAKPTTTEPARIRHTVTIDPGHGGTDPGNPGLTFPRGIHEKDVTLAVGLLLRDELLRRGVDVKMTRTTDTLINLTHRAPRYCNSDCDLFVSLHVNSLDKAPGYDKTRGFETFFLDKARTEDAIRVAKMENSAVRYEAPEEKTAMTGLDFMLKDMQTNEFLRLSADAAAIMQGGLRSVHTGPDRGVKQANFAVLTTARSPAVLVEMGFSTNVPDGQLMSTRAGQERLAKGLADAIMNFLNQVDLRTDRASPDR